MTRRYTLPILWGLLVLAMLSHNLFLFAEEKVHPDTDIMTLLPTEKRDLVLQKAFDNMIKATEQRIIVLVGAQEWDDAVEAAETYSGNIQQHPDLFAMNASSPEAIQLEWLDFFRSHRTRLLTADQTRALESQPENAWADIALHSLYSPFYGISVLPWQNDPFNLFNDWMQHQMQSTPVRPKDGKLFVAVDGKYYIVLSYLISSSSFSLDAQEKIIPVLDQAKEAALSSEKKIDILTGGVILHAEKASKQAAREMSTIGIGSLVGIILLILLTFRSPKPIAFVFLSLATGVVGAFSVCHLVFDHIHFMTLVFGASLIGVAQDYSIYFLCNRTSADENVSTWDLMRKLLPGMSLVLSTILIGYLGLMLTPFPGLHQMAFFAISGLICAWLTVICWFPFLIKPHTLTHKPKLDWYKKLIDSWPVVQRNRGTTIAFVFFIVVAATGIACLNVNDDIRLLQTPDKALVDEQIKINRLLDVPAPAQFYLVRGKTVESVLQREEQLKEKLDSLVRDKTINRYLALSDWVPSLNKQERNESLIVQKLLGQEGPLDDIARRIGEGEEWVSAIQQQYRKASSPLYVDDFLSLKAGESMHHMWIGKVGDDYASIITINGVTLDNLAFLSRLAENMEGVLWVDKINEVSSVLGYYRQYMSYVVLFSFVAIYLLLFIRYRLSAWRVVAPPLLSIIGTMAILGLIGENLQLFNIIAFMLILGLGVDYGIFLMENVAKSLKSVWLEIGLSAVTTLLAFGLLSISRTPALHSFGLTVLVGIIMVWLLTPCFRKSL